MNAVARLALLVLLAVSPGTGWTAPPPEGSAALAGPVPGAPIERYGIVTPGVLSRSAKPRPADYAWLRQQGITGIVNFTDDRPADALLRAAGIERYLWLPIEGGAPPTDEEVERFLRFVQERPGGQVHMHCAEGKTRTGVMAALYRYAVEGWALERALEEAKLYRKGKSLPSKYVDWLRRWAARHPPGSYRLAAGGEGR
ncbi:MAG TPA: tyrosine-protein phosphatase [Thermodesulfobacteriota bacterium]|nr:tyrosine-protein phosphatase [Thermodesulfobacteriota bacterium]